MKKAVILLSGGLDSTTCLAMATAEGFSCYALSFSYGQRHAGELAAAKRVALHYQVAEHRIITLDLNQFGGSALTDHRVDVPDFCDKKEIPMTYVPARNTTFLSLALGYAEVIEAFDIFIGVSSIDYSHYPDCRPEYLAAFQALANLATKASVEGRPTVIHAPLLYLSKACTIRRGIELNVDYSLTLSCYQATETGKACGRCDSCHFRREGFRAASVIDPTVYR